MLFFTYVCFLVVLFCLSLFHIFFAAVDVRRMKLHIYVIKLSYRRDTARRTMSVEIHAAHLERLAVVE